jgi:hypothetical protein
MPARCAALSPRAAALVAQLPPAAVIVERATAAIASQPWR